MLVHHQHHGHKKGEADNKDDGLSSSDAIIVGGVVTALKLRWSLQEELNSGGVMNMMMMIGS